MLCTTNTYNTEFIRLAKIVGLFFYFKSLLKYSYPATIVKQGGKCEEKYWTIQR